MADNSSASQTSTPYGNLFHRGYIAPSLWLAAASVATIVAPWCLIRVVDNGIIPNDMHALALWLTGAALAQIASGIFRYLGTCGMFKQASKLEMQQRSHLYARLMNADLRFLPDISQGTAIGQLLSAAMSNRHFIEMLYTQGVPLITMIIGTFFALLTLSPSLACISLGVFPIAALLWLWLKRRIRPSARQDYETQESLYAHLVDSLRAITSIRALHQTPRFIRKMEDIAANCLHTGYLLYKRMAIQSPALDILQAIVLIAVFGIGGHSVANDTLSIGALLGFQIYLARLFGIIRGGTGIFGAWQQFLEGRLRALQIENLPATAPFSFAEAQSPVVLNIENLSFSFGDHPVWVNKSLTVNEGQKCAILLPSGGGKTTLARCILGLYPIEQGTIALPNASSKSIGFVPQENVLFDGTIRDNIALMCDALDDATYTDILHMCGLESLAERMQNSPIGDQGSKLSGGEQRRVMLARALASHPKLLIIDQMASELEPDLCRTIFERIQAKMPRLGILYFGHRLPEWD